MTASLFFFTTLVCLALIVTVLAPLLLLVLFIADYKKGALW